MQTRNTRDWLGKQQKSAEREELSKAERNIRDGI